MSTAIDNLVKDTEKRMNQRSKALQSSGTEGKKGTDLSSLLYKAAGSASNKTTRYNIYITSRHYEVQQVELWLMCM